MALPDPTTFLLLTAGLTLLVALVSILFEKRATEAEKRLFFLLIAVPILLSTLYLAFSTVAHNLESETGGPIHWHADYQVWTCGERLDLIDPDFPSNKIGSPLFHEHNDDRIHVEGTVGNIANVDLGAYFNVIGGHLTSTSLTYPTDRGVVEVGNGQLCGNNPGELAVYVNGERIENPEDYLYYPHAYIPPGDCIIVSFEPSPADTTDRICESWAAEGWTYDNYEELREEVDVPDYYRPYPSRSPPGGGA